MLFSHGCKACGPLKSEHSTEQKTEMREIDGQMVKVTSTKHTTRTTTSSETAGKVVRLCLILISLVRSSKPHFPKGTGRC